MRFETKVMAALVVVPVVLMQTPASAYDLPYDPYPWCAQYSGSRGGGTNCCFLTIEQCRHRWILFNFTIREGLRGAAAAIGIVTNY
jgi:hypothetical protein